MTSEDVIPHAPLVLPVGLPLVRARLTMRLLEDAQLPAQKGGMLRGGFGYAFQRAACPERCWGRSEQCDAASVCPFRWVFATPHPPQITHLHDLQDVPRPFVIEPPDDGRTHYHAGDALEFGLVLIGRGIDHLAYFLFGFERLGRMGLGRGNAKARLERVEALRPWEPTGTVIFQDGHVPPSAEKLPQLSGAEITARAAALPDSLRLTLRTPLRIKSGGDYICSIDLSAIVRAICWRLDALATFHGQGPWSASHRELAELARSVRIENAHAEWVDWERTSTRGEEPRSMNLGGIVGRAVLHGVPAELRAVLVAGSIIHAGKACVFGHGALRLEPLQ